MIGDYLRLCLRSLAARKLRSFLTIIGIIIGVASMIALISVSSGLKNAITQQFEQFGANHIYVMAAGPGGTDPATRSGLTIKDVEVMERLSEFDYVTPYLYKNVEIGFGNEEYTKLIVGFPTDNSDKRFGDLDLQVTSGRLFTDGEKNSVVIGPKVAENFFEKELRVGNQISLNGEKLKIIGILSAVGNPDQDNMIFVPIEKIRQVTNDDNSVTMIDGITKDGVDMSALAKKLERQLENARNDDLFDVQTPDQLLESFGVILLAIQIVVGGIAGISLVVGAIGIMNSMYTSVMERTRDIGIMKSIGAKNRDILTIFLLESGIIAALGGLFGVALGTLIALGAEAATQAAGFALIVIKIDPYLIAFGIAFAFVLGMIAGALPAHHASKMKPVDAMRM